ncbi:MAG: methyltransferase domain-containing protein [Planctomycetota bacterium]|nr:methyltransferase domain-containing protein [Planctomycetota bacterium]
MDYYEQDAVIQEYLAFHYPDPERDPLQPLLGARTPPLAGRFPFVVKRHWPAGAGGRALDVGAACGRVTFDLARDHDEALGIDSSEGLIEAARRVQATGVARYRTIDEGDLQLQHEVAVEPAPNVSFSVADALNLPFEPAAFRTVVALNLVCRVPHPERAVEELARVTEPGGTLVVSSPYTWLESYTPRSHWLGGFARDGETMRGAARLRQLLEPGFEFTEDARYPFFIPHHARSGQLGLAHVQRFRKRA